MRHFYACLGFGLALLCGVMAQAVFPTCAYTCLPAGLQQTDCSSTDIKCLCQSSGWIDYVTACIRRVCSADDALNAGLYSRQECLDVGITVSIPAVSSTTAPAGSQTSVPGGGGASPSSTPTAATAVAGGSNGDSQSSSSSSAATPTGNSPSQTSSSSSSSETSNSKTSPSGGSGADNSGSGGPGSSPTPKSSSGSSNVAPIVGGVVGGVVALVALGILGFWLMKREKRKKMEMEMAGGGLPQKPPVVADANNQGIWTGDNAYSWNPQTNTHDIQGGMPTQR
ncbi:hypothetical protein TWF694_007231 [Orbilia ellipsospora]|uniref:CFEM domain-containing protein n=1 Tax=Orbilia ellipsospora TaxID=2528407 RepID=A0AAV9XH50_9PEZI